MFSESGMLLHIIYIPFYAMPHLRHSWAPHAQWRVNISALGTSLSVETANELKSDPCVYVAFLGSLILVFSSSKQSTAHGVREGGSSLAKPPPPLFLCVIIKKRCPKHSYGCACLGLGNGKETCFIFLGGGDPWRTCKAGGHVKACLGSILVTTRNKLFEYV